MSLWNESNREAAREHLARYGYAVGVVLARSHIPAGMTVESMTDADKLEAIATMLDGLDDETDLYMALRGDGYMVQREMQADLRRIAQELRTRSRA